MLWNRFTTEFEISQPGREGVFYKMYWIVLLSDLGFGKRNTSVSETKRVNHKNSDETEDAFDADIYSLDQGTSTTMSYYDDTILDLIKKTQSRKHQDAMLII